jgi:hypothetical protein
MGRDMLHTTAEHCASMHTVGALEWMARGQHIPLAPNATTRMVLGAED